MITPLFYGVLNLYYAPGNNAMCRSNLPIGGRIVRIDMSVVPKEGLFFLMSTVIYTSYPVLYFLYGRKEIKVLAFTIALSLTNLMSTVILLRSLRTRAATSRRSLTIAGMWAIDKYMSSDNAAKSKGREDRNSLIKLMSFFVVTQLIGGGFGVLAPRLYAVKTISIVTYCFVMFVSLLFINIARKYSTLNRIVDRDLKGHNSRCIKANYDDANDSGASVYKSWCLASKVELGILFSVSAITIASNWSLSQIYGAGGVTDVTYLVLASLIQFSYFVTMTYNAYSRFMSLGVVQEDNTNLRRAEDQNAVDSENLKEVSFLAVISVVMFAKILSAVGTVAVPFLYKKYQWHRAVFYVLSYVSVACTSLVYFFFDINKAVDRKLSKENVVLTENIVIASTVDGNNCNDSLDTLHADRDDKPVDEMDGAAIVILNPWCVSYNVTQEARSHSI